MPTQSSALSLSEADLQTCVIDLAQRLGWLVYHTHDSRHSAKGYPDIVALNGTVGLAIELKSEKGKVTPEQKQWLTAFAGAGFLPCIWRPADWYSGAIDRALGLGTKETL